MAVRRELGVRIARKVPTKLYPFTRFFRGFERNPAVRSLFGARAGRVLARQKVEFFSSRFGYMGTSDLDGHLLISTHHLRESDLTTIYLDLVHELCHVRQFQRGRPLFYPKLSYVDAPSEIEAYRFTVTEGRRLGLSDAELLEYLTIEWISPAELRRLARYCGVKVGPRPRRPKRRRPAR
jgi:hypothetical protein